MSNFFTAVPWQEPGFVLLPYALVGAAAPFQQWRIVGTMGFPVVPAANGARVALYDQTSLPWNTQVNGSTDVGPEPAGDTTNFDQAIANLQAQETTAMAALATAKATQAAAAVALATATAALQVAQDAVDAAEMVRIDAQVDLDIATRRNDPAAIADAQTLLNAAVAQLVPLQQTLADAVDAQGNAAAAPTGPVREAALTLETLQNLTLPLTELQRSLIIPSALPAGATRPQYGARSTLYEDFVNSVASAGSSGTLRFDDTYHCVVAVAYGVSLSMGDYQIVVPIPDDVYQALQSVACAVNVAWTEVTALLAQVPTVVPAALATTQPDPDNPHTCAPYTVWNFAPDPTVTFQAKTATLSLADAVYDEGYNAWLLSTPAGTLTPPDPGDPDTGQPPDQTTITVQGMPTPPTTAATIQLLGAEQFRQGFDENTTPQSAVYGRRFLTLSASSGPGTPVGVSYGGSISYEVPPPSVLDGTYPSTPTDCWSGDDVANRLPLVRHYTLSPDAAAAVAALESVLVTDRNLSLTPTVRTLAQPPGLILTLSGEQTPGDVQGAVAAAAGADWPTPDPVSGQYPAIPAINFAGAINCTPATGDYCGQQKMRFQLTHNANDGRSSSDTVFSTTHFWELHHRDLTTGAVTIEPHQTTVTWPNVVTITDPDGTSYPIYSYSQTDDEWTEIPVPGVNESVTLVLLPGVSSEPHTFGSVTANIVAGNADG